MKTPLISVIIPTYNRPFFLKTAIDSVLSQTYTNFELIIIDDGSTEKTKNLVSHYKNKLHYYYQYNQGVSSARNTGIRKVRGEYIAFLDSDDSWLPEKLEEQIKILTENDYKICYTNEIWIKNGKRINQKKRHQKYSGNIFKYTLPLCIISPSSVIIHKSVFDKIGIFNEKLIVCEDYDLWLRIAYHYKIYFLDKYLIIKTGGHNDQLSTKYWGMDRFRIRALLNLLQNYDLKYPQKKWVVDELKNKCKIYLNGAKKRNKNVEIEYYEKIIKRYS